MGEAAVSRILWMKLWSRVEAALRTSRRSAPEIGVGAVGITLALVGSQVPTPLGLLLLLFGLAVAGPSAVLVYREYRDQPGYQELFARISEKHAEFRPPNREGEARGEGDAEHLKFEVIGHLYEIATHAAALIGANVGGDCAISIKALGRVSAEDSELTDVFTLVRDRSSWDARTVVPEHFNYKSNRAFAAIIDEGLPYFGSDDLLALARQGGYENSNPLWPSLYTKTLVFPIRDNPTDPVVGFLCVDSMAGRLNRPRIRRRVAEIARHIYTTLGLVYVFPSVVQAAPEEIRIPVWPFGDDPRMYVPKLIGIHDDRWRRSEENLRPASSFNDYHPETQPSWGENLRLADRGSGGDRLQQEDSSMPLAKLLSVNGQSEVLSRALLAVVVDQPQVASAFFDAFDYRQQRSDLAESDGPRVGLQRALSALLRVFPDRRSMEEIGRRDIGDVPGDRIAFMSAHLKAALVGIAVEQPRSIEMFFKNIEVSGEEPATVVEALLRQYAKNALAHPL